MYKTALYNRINIGSKNLKTNTPPEAVESIKSDA